MMTQVALQSLPPDVDALEAQLLARSLRAGLSLSFLRFAMATMTVAEILPSDAAIDGDAALALRLVPVNPKMPPVLSVRMTSGRPLAEVFRDLAVSLQAGKDGVSATIEVTDEDDRHCVGEVAFAYRGRPWCSFDFVLAV